MKTNFLVVRLHSSFLTVAVDVARLGRVCQPRPFTAVDVRVAVQALTHLVTDHVHQPLEHSLRSEHYVLLLLSRCYLSNQEKTKLENMFEPLLTLTLIFSLAEVSKNCSPRLSASCFPLSYEITLSSSMSLLFPTKMTWALSQL